MHSAVITWITWVQRAYSTLTTHYFFVAIWYVFWQFFFLCLVLSSSCYCVFTSFTSLCSNSIIWVSWVFLLIMGCIFLSRPPPFFVQLVILDWIQDIVNFTLLVARQLFFAALGFELSLTLDRQALYCLSHSTSLSFCFFVLEVKPNTLCVLSNCSITELHP
jgi:hypothetical protein